MRGDFPKNLPLGTGEVGEHREPGGGERSKIIVTRIESDKLKSIRPPADVHDWPAPLLP